MSDNPERTGLDRPQKGAIELADGLVESGSDSGVSVKRILIPAAFFFIGIAYVLAGLARRQLLEADDYADDFRIQSTRVIQVPAPRGFIYDRNGELLVGNNARYNIVADLSVLRDEIREEYLKLYRNPATRAKAQTNARVNVLQRYLDRVNIVLRHQDKVDARALEKHMDPRTGKVGLDFLLVSDISPEEVARFVENFPVEYPLRLYVDSVRKYPHGDMAAHVLGYLSNTDDLGTPDDLSEMDENLADLINIRERRNSKGNPFIRYSGKGGKTGLEASCDSELRGKPGSQVWMVNPKGYLYKKISGTRAEQGSHIYCSLDYRLQEAAERGLANTEKAYHTKLRGAAIVLDVGTGEVLAMASYPRYDPNKFADKLDQDYYAKIDADGSFYNLATRGTYPPGSTFKVITAIAGMRSGVLDPDEKLECGPYYLIGGRKWPEHDVSSHPYGFGAVDVADMLKVSCNVYCYQMGLRIRIDALAAEARRLGLDSKIRMEISTAPKSQLNVPDPAWSKRTQRGGWSDSDMANTSIGQGGLVTTPMHMADMIASVAGNRTRTQPTLIHDPSHNGLTLSHDAEPLGLTEYQRRRLIDGLRACVQGGGTGSSVNVPGEDIVGKTGTAEATKDHHKINLAWFEGFAPANNPKIAVVVLVEGEAGSPAVHGGKSAGPVAHEIFAEWKKIREGK